MSIWFEYVWMKFYLNFLENHEKSEDHSHHKVAVRYPRVGAMFNGCYYLLTLLETCWKCLSGTVDASTYISMHMLVHIFMHLSYNQCRNEKKQGNNTSCDWGSPIDPSTGLCAHCLVAWVMYQSPKQTSNFWSQHPAMVINGTSSNNGQGWCFKTSWNYIYTTSSLWFQPTRKIWVKLDHVPNFRAEHKKKWVANTQFFCTTSSMDQQKCKWPVGSSHGSMDQGFGKLWESNNSGFQSAMFFYLQVIVFHYFMTNLPL